MTNVIVTELVFCILSLSLSIIGAILVPYAGNKLLSRRGLVQELKTNKTSLAAQTSKELEAGVAVTAGAEEAVAKKENAVTEIEPAEATAVAGTKTESLAQTLKTTQTKIGAAANFFSRLSLFMSYSFMASYAVNSSLFTSELFIQKALALWILFMLAFFIMQIALYCDCLCHIIPNGLCIALLALGASISLFQGGIDTLTTRLFMGFIALLFLLLCNLPNYVKQKSKAFGAGDIKIIPVLCLFANAFSLFSGMFCCCIFSASLGIIFAIHNRKLKNVHIPLAPGLLVWFMAQTVFM